jgi:hypothetical protein
MSTPKKIASTPAPATQMAAPETSAEATASLAPAPAAATITPAEILAATQSALEHIRLAQTALPLTPGLGDKARRSAMGLQMVPSDLVSEAATFLATNASRYPYDAAAIQVAAQIEESLTQVVNAVEALASRARSTVLEHRAPAIEQSLALYAMLKAQARTDGSVRSTVERMAPLVNTRKAPHQRKQQRIQAKTKKVTELSASLATSHERRPSSG